MQFHVRNRIPKKKYVYHGGSFVESVQLLKPVLVGTFAMRSGNSSAYMNYVGDYRLHYKTAFLKATQKNIFWLTRFTICIILPLPTPILSVMQFPCNCHCKINNDASNMGMQKTN